MNGRIFTLVALLLVALIVFLFVTAPPPLSEQVRPEATISFESLLTLAETENDAVRGLWTKEIVGAGQRAGLEFSEDWRDRDVEAGPLPALFLRETARNLEKNPVRLSLFLGSDAPVNPENGFKGVQQQRFRQIRATRQPQFFLMPDTGLYTAMFPDEAVVEACVDCHNEHEDSPKHDWRLDDVMGATTWAYPDERVTGDDLLAVLIALRGAFRDSYQAYLDEVATFENPPGIGSRWPRDGYYLPSTDVFMDELARRTAHGSLDALIRAVGQTEARVAAPPDGS